jgi:hypothetical protein
MGTSVASTAARPDTERTRIRCALGMETSTLPLVVWAWNSPITSRARMDPLTLSVCVRPVVPPPAISTLPLIERTSSSSPAPSTLTEPLTARSCELVNLPRWTIEALTVLTSIRLPKGTLTFRLAPLLRGFFFSTTWIRVVPSRDATSTRSTPSSSCASTANSGRSQVVISTDPEMLAISILPRGSAAPCCVKSAPAPAATEATAMEANAILARTCEIFIS